MEGIEDYVVSLLDAIQENIYQKALNYRSSHTYVVDSYEEFKEKRRRVALYSPIGTARPKPKRHQEETKAIRCIPLEGDTTPGTCIYSGKPSGAEGCFLPGILIMALAWWAVLGVAVAVPSCSCYGTNYNSKSIVGNAE